MEVMHSPVYSGMEVVHSPVYSAMEVMEVVHSPVYSAMEVMEEAVEPLSQSLSAMRLGLRLPGKDSTESQLEQETDINIYSLMYFFLHRNSHYVYKLELSVKRVINGVNANQF